MAESLQSMIDCLKQLESNFEKASVDLDVIIGDPEFDKDGKTAFQMQRKLQILSSSFSQLYHRLHLVIRTNQFLRAGVSRLREELIQAKAKCEASDVEMSDLLMYLHASQLQLHAATSGDVNGDFESITNKLAGEMDSFRKAVKNQSYLKEENAILKKENAELNQQVAIMGKELYGARLAAKYMDKEICGRIQQIQLLEQNDKLANFEKLWRQLDSEVSFHRQKTVIKTYQGPIKREKKICNGNNQNKGDFAKIRLVTLNKKPEEGLGIAVIGGKEHGVQIIITEIYEDGVAKNNGGLMVGDAILSVNGVNIRDYKHSEAIQVLSQKIDIFELEVLNVNVSGDSDDDDYVLEAEIAEPGSKLEQKPTMTDCKATSSVMSTPSSSVSTSEGSSVAAFSHENDYKTPSEKSLK